jgi:hypothetical protein
MGVAAARRLMGVYGKTHQKCVAEKPTKRAILDADLVYEK